MLISGMVPGNINHLPIDSPKICQESRCCATLVGLKGGRDFGGLEGWGEGQWECKVASCEVEVIVSKWECKGWNAHSHMSSPGVRKMDLWARTIKDTNTKQ